MSGTHHLVAHSDYSFLLRTKATAAQRMAVVKMLRQHAAMILAKATTRIPVEKPSIIAAYRARGIEPVWDLSDNGDALRFCDTLPMHGPTPAENDAAELLRACVCADEIGDVPEFKSMHVGRAASEAQANRRRGQSKLSDSQKKQVAREYEDALSKYGLVKSLARRFDVSEDTISREINKKRA